MMSMDKIPDGNDLVLRSDAIRSLGRCPDNRTNTGAEWDAQWKWEHDIIAITQLPAVDAIPVSWLNGLKAMRSVLGLTEPECDAINAVLHIWSARHERWSS